MTERLGVCLPWSQKNCGRHQASSPAGGRARSGAGSRGGGVRWRLVCGRLHPLSPPLGVPGTRRSRRPGAVSRAERTVGDSVPQRETCSLALEACSVPAGFPSCLPPKCVHPRPPVHARTHLQILQSLSLAMNGQPRERTLGEDVAGGKNAQSKATE